MNILTTAEMDEQISELLQSTSYDGEEVPKDEHGMPIVAPEPEDPDDE